MSTNIDNINTSEIRETADWNMRDIDYDIQIGDFEISWNLKNSNTFAIDETSINEAGCIYTSQGLEFHYAFREEYRNMQILRRMLEEFKKSNTNNKY